MKPIAFEGNSLAVVRAFPAGVRAIFGFQLDKVQRGLEPDDFRSLSTVGQGVYEIRVRDASGAYRVIYIAKFDNAVHVLHAFKKKTQRTAKADMDVARERLRDVVRRG